MSFQDASSTGASRGDLHAPQSASLGPTTFKGLRRALPCTRGPPRLAKCYRGSMAAPFKGPFKATLPNEVHDEKHD